MAEDFVNPEDWDPDDDIDPSRPALHSSHVVMVGVSAEVAIAIAVASFVMGAALTGALCYFLQFRKNAAKRVSGDYSFSGQKCRISKCLAFIYFLKCTKYEQWEKCRSIRSVFHFRSEAVD